MIEDRHSHSHKREQLASTLGQVVQTLITRGIADPRIVGIITVTGCDVAPDYSHAIIKVSVLPQKNEAKVMGGLRHAAGHFRRQARDRIHARNIPELRFELDSSLKRQAALIGALSQVVAEREAAGGSAEAGVPAQAGVPAEAVGAAPSSPWVGPVRPPAPPEAPKPKKARPKVAQGGAPAASKAESKKITAKPRRTAPKRRASRAEIASSSACR